jgi:RHS repeat-associated protein
MSTSSDYTGNTLNERLFYPFGESWTGAALPNLGTHQTFAQLPDYDPETDQYNTANRHYSPSGRWMSPDPGGVKVVRLDDPQTWNMYAYARNNPTTLTDPSGLDPVPEVPGACTIPQQCKSATSDGQGKGQVPAQNQSNQQTQQTQQQPKKGGGVLPTGAAAIDLGVGKAGVTAQGSAAVGAFVDNKGHPHVGAEASGSVDAYAGQHTAAKPQQDKDSFVLGAFAGVGGGLTFTNAGNAPAMKTMTNTLNIDLGIGPAASISVSSGHSGVTSFTITFGWGYGAAVTETNTSTVTAPSQ